MRAHHVRRTAAIAIALVCGVAGCSVLPSTSGKDEQTASGLTYGEALEAMKPDVVSALKATMPGIELEESSSADDCGGLDILDSKDGSKRKGAADITLAGDPSDKRESKELVEEVMDHLTSRGWTVEKQARTVPPGEPRGYMLDLTKSGMHGGVTVSASPFKLSSGKISQSLGASVVTDCLRNPD